MKSPFLILSFFICALSSTVNNRFGWTDNNCSGKGFTLNSYTLSLLWRYLLFLNDKVLRSAHHCVTNIFCRARKRSLEELDCITIIARNDFHRRDSYCSFNCLLKQRERHFYLYIIHAAAIAQSIENKEQYWLRTGSHKESMPLNDIESIVGTRPKTFLPS
jgi:hypothetical protein